MTPLTVREQEILDLMCHGLSAKQVGRAIGRSPQTINWYTAQIRRKTGARTLLQAFAILRLGESYRQNPLS